MGNEDEFIRNKAQEYEKYCNILQNTRCHKPVSLPFDFLKDITSDFSQEKMLGSGGFGAVYKGVLRNGNAVAVKKLRIEMDLPDENYFKELKNLYWLDHKNVVQFKGYCDQTTKDVMPDPKSPGGKDLVKVEYRERLLCFEYVPNKSLREHITGILKWREYNTSTSYRLEWFRIFEIIKEICSGLIYLHQDRQMAHMDLKPENILLDDNWVPKIADFGISRFISEGKSHTVTKHQLGSRRYMAPEYFEKGTISFEADIFSFGVIILELLTGSKSDYPGEEKFEQFTTYVIEKWRNRLPHDGYIRQVDMCVSIALKCVLSDRQNRPAAQYIIEKLHQVQEPNTSLSVASKTSVARVNSQYTSRNTVRQPLTSTNAENAYSQQRTKVEDYPMSSALEKTTRIRAGGVDSDSRSMAPSRSHNANTSSKAENRETQRRTTISSPKVDPPVKAWDDRHRSHGLRSSTLDDESFRRDVESEETTYPHRPDRTATQRASSSSTMSSSKVEPTVEVGDDRHRFHSPRSSTRYIESRAIEETIHRSDRTSTRRASSSSNMRETQTRVGSTYPQTTARTDFPTTQARMGSNAETSYNLQGRSSSRWPSTSKPASQSRTWLD